MTKLQRKIFLQKDNYFIHFVESKRNSTKITGNKIIISFANSLYLIKKYKEFKFKNTGHSLSWKNLKGVKLLQKTL